MSMSPADRSGVQIPLAEEVPLIREQDLAVILADWVRLKTQYETMKAAVNGGRRELDALDFTILVGELSTGLHARSLEVILAQLPQDPRWDHLRHRLEVLLRVRAVDEFADYPVRQLPVY